MRRYILCLGSAIFCATLVASGFAHAQDQPGQVFHLKPADLPAPYATQSVANSSDTVARDDRVPEAPPGFTVGLYASGVSGARKLVVAADGTVIVARSRAGKVTALRDTNGDGIADQSSDITPALNRPHGLTFRDGALWIADQERVYRLGWADGHPTTPLEAMSVRGIFGGTGGHWTRNIAFSRDGRFLYASIGSRSNIAEEDAPRASIQRYAVTPDGRIGAATSFATGLRNPVGIAMMPGTDRLFTVVNERDGLGDGLVPDYFTEVEAGAFYGWPYAYIGSNPQPDYGQRRPDMVANTTAPDVLFQSHSAPLGITFLADADVPDDWRDDALVALHGSWNAAVPTGYKVVRIEFEGGKPTGRYINFLTGFRIDTPQPGRQRPARVWGRPVGVATGPDGAIYVSDDAGGTIWRITR